MISLTYLILVLTTTLISTYCLVYFLLRAVFTICEFCDAFLLVFMQHMYNAIEIVQKSSPTAACSYDYVPVMKILLVI